MYDSILILNMSCCQNFNISSPIIALLSKDVLTGDNFQKLKSDLNIILAGENMSQPGLVFQRAATVIKYYYYFYSNFTSDFFLTCSNYTCISLVKHNSTSVLLQLGYSHICDSRKRLSVFKYSVLQQR